MRIRFLLFLVILVTAAFVLAQQSSQQSTTMPQQSGQQPVATPQQSGQQPIGQPTSTPQTSKQQPMTMSTSGQEPMVKTAQENAFKTVPNYPGCLTASIERGDPKAGPHVLFLKETTGCAVPWHQHSANTEVMFVSGSARVEMKGQPAQTVGPGSYVYVPANEQHQDKCVSSSCTFYVIRDGAADIHYVDAAGNEISPETALSAVGEHPAATVAAKQ